jgi:hypothetical protein
MYQDFISDVSALIGARRAICLESISQTGCAPVKPGFVPAAASLEPDYPTISAQMESTMKHLFVLTVIAAAVIAAECATANGVSITVDDKTLDETRAVAGKLVTQLGARLKAEMSAHGPAAAVSVCKNAAPEIAGKLSQETGWKVGRVGTRVRNPLNSPNVWQQAALDEFAKRMAGGEKLDGMESWKVVQEGGKPTLLYAKAIGVQAVCLTCHGGPDSIPDEVKARLKVDYPGDKAVGYSAGELRGAIVISRPL